MKNTLLFIGSTNILVRLLTVNMKTCLSPQKPIMCDTILVINRKCDPIIVNSVVKMRPQSSGISPLASYRKYTPRGLSRRGKRPLPAGTDLEVKMYMYSQLGRNFISKKKREKDFLGRSFREWKIIFFCISLRTIDFCSWNFFEKILKRFYLIIGNSKFREIMIINDTLNEKSKDYCKADSEQRVLFFHNNTSAGHTSLLQV